MPMGVAGVVITGIILFAGEETASERMNTHPGAVALSSSADGDPGLLSP